MTATDLWKMPPGVCPDDGKMMLSRWDSLKGIWRLRKSKGFKRVKCHVAPTHWHITHR